MALQSTTKIRLFVSAQKEVEVLSFLQERGVMEVVSITESKRTDVENKSELAVAKLDFAIRYLSSFAEEKKGLRNSVLGEKLEISEKEAEEKISGCDWESIVEKVSVLEAEKNDLNRELAESRVALKTFLNFKGVDISASEGVYSSSFFVVPLKNAEKFLKSVQGVSPYLEILEGVRTESSVSFVVFSREPEKTEILLVLSQLKGSEIDLELGVSPAQKIKKLEDSIVQAEDRLSRNFDLSVDLAKNIDALKMCYDKFASESEVGIALRGVEKKLFISVVEGWVESSRLEEVKDELALAFGAVEIEEIEKSKKEVARVILAPSSFMAPIMEVTKMFGTPKIEEVDPTPYYAFFFVLFFGFCLTDAGYGIVLVLMTALVLLLKLPFDKSVTNMIKMFMYGGVSTIVMGMLFGGWFGLTVDQVPEALTYLTDDGKRMFLGQVFDPMLDLVGKIMPLAYVLGILHLSLGLYLSGVIAWKLGDKNRMLFVSLPMISMFVFASLTWVAGIEVFVYAFYLAMILSMWGLGKSGSPILRILKGFGGLLNESLGWFSNILSYSRLFALGLATGIIAMSFNIVAMTMGGMVPGVGGWIVTLVVLAFGHTLNIALNVLGAYVHSSRLQFVEFFGMFLEGGGGVFKPLRKVCRFRHTS